MKWILVAVITYIAFLALLWVIMLIFALFMWVLGSFYQTYLVLKEAYIDGDPYYKENYPYTVHGPKDDIKIRRR